MFKQTEEAILQGLVRILSDISSVDYMEPIARFAREQDGGLDVLTLNYDLTVETLAQQFGVPLTTGIEDWQPGTPLFFPAEDGRINLLKMHGSLNWEHEGAASPTEPVQIRVRSDDDTAEEVSQLRPRRQSKPWIVVGDREKLATDGPTLYLFAAAQEILARTDNLVVVGYGFADIHINNLIRDWMLGSSERTITLLDPSITADAADVNEFRAALIAAYGAKQADLRSRVGFIPKGALDGLEEALYYNYPEPIEAGRYFKVLPTSDKGDYSVARLVCEGPSVSNVQVSVSVGDTANDDARTSPLDAGTSESDLKDKLEGEDGPLARRSMRPWGRPKRVQIEISISCGIQDNGFTSCLGPSASMFPTDSRLDG